jgi:hypothetical protein
MVIQSQGERLCVCTLGAYKFTHWLIPESEITFWQEFLGYEFEHTECVPDAAFTWIVHDDEDHPRVFFDNVPLSPQEIEDFCLKEGWLVAQGGHLSDLPKLSHREYAERRSLEELS